MTERPRVLILEDEVIVALDVEAELKDHGYTVAGHAATLPQAFAILENTSFDVALLDVNIRDGRSFEFARACRSRGIRVIFMSGYAAHTLPEDLRGEPLLRKPVQYRRLFALL